MSGVIVDLSVKSNFAPYISMNRRSSSERLYSPIFLSVCRQWEAGCHDGGSVGVCFEPRNIGDKAFDMPFGSLYVDEPKHDRVLSCYNGYNGDNVKVLEPTELAVEIQTTAKNILSRYL